MIEVAGRPIGADNPPFVIAEMSGNHNQSLDRALHLIDAAAEAGAHAIKLQTATPEGLTLECGSDDFRINDASSPWYGRNLFELYREAVTPWEWHETLYAHARAAGLIVFSSPFELAAVDFLETLDSPCYKIASFELVDHQLIRKTAATGKPLIMSTGIATLAEIADAVNVAKSEGNEKIILLKCTSTYPASPIDSNLKTIPHLRDAFGLLVGLSDHTLGVGVPCAAVSLGACVIEKHFTLSRAEGGVDASFSLEPHELKALVEETKQAWQAIGEITYGGAESEKASLKFRRSIYVAESMEDGEQFTEKNLRVVRPGYGLSPKFIEVLLGRRANKKLEKGTPMSWDHIG